MRLGLTLALGGCTPASEAPRPTATASYPAALGTAPNVAADSVAYRLVRDAAGATPYPQIRHPARPAVEREVNRALAELRDANGPCDVDGDEGAGGVAAGADTYHERRHDVRYAAHDVFSVEVHESYYCGGPYPTNDANTSRTFDLRTGAVVPFDSLFADAARDRAAIARAVQPVLLAARGVAGGADDDCAGALSVEGLQGEFAYALSPGGLIVQPVFPHVIEACAERATVPYARVRAFARPGGVLARVADAEVAAAGRVQATAGRASPSHAVHEEPPVTARP